MKLDHTTPRLTSVSLYLLLRRHGLLPVSLGEDGLQRAIAATAANARFAVVTEDGGVVASVLTYQLEPGILGVQWIPEMKGLNKNRPALWALSDELREFWFRDGVRRIEARVPKSRIQTIKALKTMGFRQETTDHGLRQAVDYGKGFEAFIVLGLLESDPVHKHDSCLNIEPVGVGHGHE